MDLAVLGAGWDIDRARELRGELALVWLVAHTTVDTSVFTTFYLGALTNRDEVHSRHAVPRFEILFRVSYGMSRDQLEVYNENLRLGRWANKPYDRDDPYKRVRTLVACRALTCSAAHWSLLALQHPKVHAATFGPVRAARVCRSDGRWVSAPTLRAGSLTEASPLLTITAAV